ncbi:MAG TPA: hypothetical protein VI759_02435 [Dehalococcoidia bacterium]|nr:hypothetical protein [Dehalococcoidia bacterium]
MAHKGKPGTRAVSIDITPEQREEILCSSGEKTLTAAVNKALAEFVIQEQLRAAHQSDTDAHGGDRNEEVT